MNFMAPQIIAASYKLYYSNQCGIPINLLFCVLFSNCLLLFFLCLKIVDCFFLFFKICVLSTLVIDVRFSYENHISCARSCEQRCASADERI